MRISGEQVYPSGVPSPCGAGGVDADVVLLAGAVGHESRWTHGLPRPLLPLPGTTLLEALVQRLSAALSGGRTVCANGRTDIISSSLSTNPSLTVQYYEDRLPRGTAGCLLDSASRLSSGTILVAGGSVWLEDDPRWMIEAHRQSGNVLTVYGTPHETMVQRAGHQLLKPAGVYCCDRAVLDYIRPAGFQDLKEQTIPALRKAGLRVGAVTLPSRTCEVSSWQTYLRVLARCLTTGLFATGRYNRLAPGIWTGRDVHVAPTARIVGPAFLDDGCSVGEGALVFGPAFLGRNVRVGGGARLIRSLAESGASLPGGFAVTNGLVRAGGRARRLDTPAASKRSVGPLLPGVEGVS